MSHVMWKETLFFAFIRHLLIKVKSQLRENELSGLEGFLSQLTYEEK